MDNTKQAAIMSARSRWKHLWVEEQLLIAFLWCLPRTFEANQEVSYSSSTSWQSYEEPNHRQTSLMLGGSDVPTSFILSSESRTASTCELLWFVELKERKKQEASVKHHVLGHRGKVARSMLRLFRTRHKYLVWKQNREMKQTDILSL